MAGPIFSAEHPDPYPAYSPGTCGLTILRTISAGSLATKRWRWNGRSNAWERVSNYNAGAHFTVREMPISSLDDLATAVDKVRCDPRTFIVRGSLTDWARQAVAGNPGYQIRQRKLHKGGIVPTLVEAPLPWLMIDIGGWPLPEWADLADDPDSAIEAAITVLLPEAFHDVECYWHLSSSAGFVTGVLKVHLFFWLAEPATNAHAKAVLKQHVPMADLSLYNAAQPHYIADPIIEGGHDPLPRRSGWRKGAREAVALPTLRPNDGTARTRDPFPDGQAELGNSITDVLHRLGDGDGRHGFHAPLRRATFLYARQCHTGGGRDDEHFIARLRDAVRASPWDPGKRDGIDAYTDEAYLDRLIDGAFALLASKPEQSSVAPHFPAPTIGLDEATVVLHAAIAAFLGRVSAWYAAPPEQCGPAEHAAVRAITGLGKSRITRELVVAWVAEAKAAGRPYRVLWLVPTHKLGAEAEAEFQALSANVAVFRGREQPDMSQSTFGEPGLRDVPLCLNLDAVKDALSIGADIEAEVCGTLEGAHCPYRRDCGYQKQKLRVARADIVIAAHNFLFHRLPDSVLDGIGLVVIDEGWWQHGLDPGREVRLAGFSEEPLVHPVLRSQQQHQGPAETICIADQPATNDLHALSVMAQRALEATPDDAFVDKAAVEAAGLTATACGEAIKLEWRRKRVGVVYPGMPLQARQEAVRAAKGNAAIGRRVGVWRALQELLQGDQAQTGRLQLAIGGGRAGMGRVVLLHQRRPILDAVADLPILALDATLPLEVVRHFLPRLQLVADVQAKAPHQHVVVVTGGWGKTSLIPHGKADEDENRRRQRMGALLRDFVALQAQRNGVVITYEGFEANFSGLSGVRTAHFNAIAGLDEFRDVGVLTIVGRPLPAPDDVRAMALALTGRPIAAEQPERQLRGLLRADGTGQAIECRVYADPDREMIRAAVTDAEVLQAIGRARGVRRNAANPVTVLLCADVVLPVIVSQVVHWQEVQPALLERMVARGVVLTSPRDFFVCFPELCDGSIAAAEKALQRDGKWADFPDISLRVFAHRGMSGKCPLFPFRYRPVGRGQQTRQAWFIPAIVPDPRAWLEARLGPLGYFEMIAQSEPKTHMDSKETGTAEASSMMDNAGMSDDGLHPVQLYAPMMSWASPVGLWRSASGIRIEEVATAKIVPEPKSRAVTPVPVALFSYCEKRLERVTLKWSVPEVRIVRNQELPDIHSRWPPELIMLFGDGAIGL